MRSGFAILDSGFEGAAVDFAGDFNTGAYASWGPTVANRVPVHAMGPYAVPNVQSWGEAFFGFATGAMRASGEMYDGFDAAQFLLLGSSTVQVCTSAMLRGPRPWPCSLGRR